MWWTRHSSSLLKAHTNMVHKVALAINWIMDSPPREVPAQLQRYRQQTDVFTKLFLYWQLEKERIQDYYNKFMSLKSQLPLVEDGDAIHYVVIGLRTGHQYSHCTRDPPSLLQELYQLFKKYVRFDDLHYRKIKAQQNKRYHTCSKSQIMAHKSATSTQNQLQQVYNINQ